MRQVLDDTKNQNKEVGENIQRLEDRNSLYEEVYGLKEVIK